MPYRYYQYSIYTNFSSTDHLPHDWSFVVWSDQEPVRILVNSDDQNSSPESGSYTVQEIAPEFQDLSAIPQSFPEQEPEVDESSDYETYEFEFPLTLEEIEIYWLIKDSPNNLTDEQQAFLTDINERVYAWAVELGIESMPVEEIIYWSEEELKAEAVKPSKEELE